MLKYSIILVLLLQTLSFAAGNQANNAKIKAIEYHENGYICIRLINTSEVKWVGTPSENQKTIGGFYFLTTNPNCGQLLNVLLKYFTSGKTVSIFGKGVFYDSNWEEIDWMAVGDGTVTYKNYQTNL